MKQNLWGGRFEKQMTDVCADYSESISFDHILYPYSIRASMAHADMLAACGIISESDNEQIQKGLLEVKDDLDSGRVEFDIHDEDIMMTIEKLLTEKIGEPGKRLHTARSRNDQNVVDELLFLRDAIKNTQGRILDLLEVIVKQAEAQKYVLMPGFTHLQHAQPITVGYYYMGHFQGLRRDYERLSDIARRNNVNPLGACALAGTTLPTDRFMTTRALGFDRPTENGLDTIGSRDGIAEYIFNAALSMARISGFAEEIVTFASSEFSFIDIDDAYCTGSSIMPQKKNPDMAELARGKVARVIGDLNTVLVMLKGTFLTLNHDYQEDKEALFDAIHTYDRTITMMARMLENITFREEVLREQLKKGFIEATDVAEYLVMQGVPFREAHELVGTLVKYCEIKGKSFPEVTSEDLAAAGLGGYGLNDLSDFTVERCVEKRNSFGGTSYSEVDRQIAAAKEFIASCRTGRE
ncbi:MAG: argininosuccinate lyase [Clostridia bacterium]|nr:argininosuccinate lyase [Clostridia bacterium]